MARGASRRGWRQLYRRSRLYVPLAVVLLLAMAVYLPLSPPWLANSVRDKARAATGLPISVDRVRVRLWTAEVELFGLRLEAKPGGVPFELGEVRLSGTMPELLAGDGGWPDRIVVSNPSVVALRETEEGIVPEGALATLLDAIASLPKGNGGSSGGGAAKVLARATPEIHVRNVSFYGDALSTELPDTHITLYSVDIPARAGAGEPANAAIRGLVTAGGSEEVSVHATWQPSARRLTVKTTATGIGHTFPIKGFGGIAIASENLDGEFVAQEREDGRVEVRVSGDFGRFSLEETRLGGERWIDEDLRLRLNGYYDPVGKRLDEVVFRLESPQIDVGAAGNAALAADRNCDVRLEVARVPPIAFALLRREAAAEGIDVDDATSSTIALDLRAKGSLADLRHLAIDGGIDVADWRLTSAAWPGPLHVRRLKGRVENSVISITEGDVSFAGVEARATLHGPLPRPGVEAQPMTATVDARGDASAVFAVAQTFATVPNEWLGIEAPMRVEGTATLPVGYGDAGVFVDALAEGADWNVAATWEAGSVVLRDLPEPVRIEAGGATATKTEATLSNLRASCAGLRLDVSGKATAEGASLLAGMPRASIDVAAEGPIPVGMSLAARFVPMPLAHDQFSGTVRVSASAEGVVGAWDDLLWAGRVEFVDVAGGFPVPYSHADFDQLNALVSLERDRVAIDRLSARVENDARVEATAELTQTGLVATAKVESSMKTVEHILPKDLNDFVSDGRGAGDAVVKMTLKDPLPPGPDLVRRYVATFSKPGALQIGIDENAPVRLDIDARIKPGEGASFYHRDFPHPITEIRGDVRADETGFQFHDVMSTWGTAKDVKVNGWVTLGHTGVPRIEFDLEAPEIDLNDWIEGWGDAPYAEEPFVRPPRPRPAGYHYVTIDGRIRLARTRFLTVRAQDVDGTIKFDSWSGREGELDARLDGSSVYGGRIVGTGHVWFPQEKGKLGRFETDLSIADVQLLDFMGDLLKRPAETSGLVTGTARFGGRIGDYSTWKGEGAYRVRDSNFIGGAAFRGLATALNMGNRANLSPTEINGTATMLDNVIEFPDMVVESDDIQMLAPGRVQVITGAIDFRLSVNLLEGALQRVPFLGTVNRVLNEFKNRFVAFHVTGTVGAPKVEADAFAPDRDTFFNTGRKALNATAERLKDAEERFRPFKRTTATPTPTPAP